MVKFGYFFCAHAHCFATIIGKPGDLCDDCKEASGNDAEVSHCNGCENDQ